MKKFKNLVVLGIVLEVVILSVCYSQSESIAETWKYAARYSGRLSLIVFLIAMWQFMLAKKEELTTIKALTGVFAILHYIHLFLLWMNVKANAITLIPYKLAGGALAYLMILLYPLFFDRFKEKKVYHVVYFLYVAFVMAMTYIARLKGDFEGAAPELFHKIGLGLTVLSMLYFTYSKIIKGKAA